MDFERGPDHFYAKRALLIRQSTSCALRNSQLRFLDAIGEILFEDLDLIVLLKPCHGFVGC
jgi:hypothetical protein